MLLTLWGSTGCAEAPTDPWYYANQFYQDAITYNVDASSVKFVFEDKLIHSSGKRAAGICSCGTNIITIDRKIWSRYIERQRRELIYHEMGHCALRIVCKWTEPPHPSNGLIMAPSLSNIKDDNWDSAVSTLFKERR